MDNTTFEERLRKELKDALGGCSLAVDYKLNKPADSLLILLGGLCALQKFADDLGITTEADKLEFEYITEYVRYTIASRK